MKIILTIIVMLFSGTSFAQSPELVIPRGHSDAILQLAVSPDGKLLASGSKDGTIKLWDIETGKELKTFDRHPGIFVVKPTLDFSQDSKKLIIGDFHELRIIDITNGSKEIFTKKIHDENIGKFAFSPNEKILVTATIANNKDVFEIKIWNSDNFTLTKTIKIKAKLLNFQFESSDQIVVSTAEEVLHINVNNGKTISSFKIDLSDINMDLGEISFSPDAHLLIIAANEKDNSLYGYGKAVLEVIDLTTKTLIRKFTETEKSFVKGLVCTPDGHYFLKGQEDGSVNMYDLQKMEFSEKINGKPGDANVLRFNAEGTKLFQGTDGKVILERNFNDKKITKEFGGEANEINDMCISPDGRVLTLMDASVFNGNYYLRNFDLTKGTTLKTIKITGNKNIQYSKDGKYILTGADDSLHEYFRLLNAGSLNKTEGLIKSDIATVFSLSPDGKTLAGYNDHISPSQLTLFSFPEGKILHNFELVDKVESIVFTEDGSTVYVQGMQSNNILKIDLQTGSTLKTFPHQPSLFTFNFFKAVPLILSKNGNTLIYKGTNFVNTLTGQELSFADSLNYPQVMSIKTLPKSNSFITSIRIEAVNEFGVKIDEKSAIKIFDFESQKMINKLTDNGKISTSLAASPDGKFLFAGNTDRSIGVWDLTKNECGAHLVFFGEKDWVIVDKVGRFDGTEAGMHKMYYAKGLTILPLESGFEQFYTPNLLPRILGNENFTPPIVDINTIKDAPVVKISLAEQQRNLSVEDDTPAYNSDKETATLKVKADCPLDAVTEIRLYQNGKLVQTTRNLTVEDEKNGEKSLLKIFTVNLTAGANNFKATAFNSQRTESRADAITINYKSLNIPDKPDYSSTTLHLLIIGINAYKNPKYTLNYAKADATSFKEQMEKPNDLFSDIKVHFITDADATKINIENTFKEIIKDCKPKDVFLFYYAGHGVMSTDKSKDFYIVPYDVLQLYGADDALAQKGISARELQEFSKNIPAQKQLFILDACQSAGALEAISMRGAAEEKAIAQLARSTGTHWLTASGSEQFATEFSQLGHGVFTYVLLEGLKGGAANSQKLITINELKAYLETQVPELTQKYKGTAQYPASYGLGNDFPVEVIK